MEFTCCGSLLSELQKLWDEVGEPESEKDKILVELEEECLNAYRCKVEQANHCRDQLHKEVANAEAELAFIYSALGEQPLHPSQSFGSLKEELNVRNLQLEEMRKIKYDRMDQFNVILNEIKDISEEISSFAGEKFNVTVNENDLSLKKLEELNKQLHALQKVKNDRMKQVLQNLDTLKSLCAVLDLDFKQTVSRIHHSLDDSMGPKNASIETMERLSYEIQRLNELKVNRLKQLQDLAANMVELWSLMDIPTEEQLIFQNVIKIMTISVNQVTEPNTLSLDFICSAETEVSRLQQMKTSKIKEVIVKKRLMLDDLCRTSHLVLEEHSEVDYSFEAIESGKLDPSYELEYIERKIAKVKEESLSRKDVIDKFEKWLAACEEENWLEEYNKDETRYNAGRGTHLVLKRAEKARVAVNKIPAMVETLTSKATTWMNARGADFTYDGVSILAMLENYTALRQEKELDRQRKRNQKKLHGQLIAEQEVMFGSKPSPTKSGKKIVRVSVGGEASRRFSLANNMLKTMKTERNVHSSNPLKKSNLVKQNSQIKYQIYSPVDLSYGKIIRNTSSLTPEQTQLTRNPLSLVNSSLAFKPNSVKVQHDNNLENIAYQKTNSNYKTPLETPAKVISSFNDENKTPENLTILVLTPPSMTKSSMQTTNTPGIVCVNEFVEYSLEERRASSILHNSYLK